MKPTISTPARVLVSYASRFGSTGQVAKRIAERLRDQGHEVRVSAAEDTSSVEGYDAVVLGSGVYDGAWAEAATELVRRETETLATMPVWLFSVGSFGDRHPVIGGLVRREPKEIGEFEQAVHPRDYRVFAGVIDLTHWPTWARLLFQALGGRDGDNRSWPDIEAWADEIAEALVRRSPAQTSP
jgi:menaquinone-dependent protoporphyrinogen oxidase